MAPPHGGPFAVARGAPRGGGHPEMDESGGGSWWGAERPVSAPLEILDNARDRIRIGAEEAGQLPDAGPLRVPRNAAALNEMLEERLRQLPADRDRAARIDVQVHQDLHTV